jgi:hypothetical protein
MPVNNIEIYFDAHCPPKSIETRAKHMRILSIVGMLLAGVLVIASVAAALEVGEQAPDFTLPSTTGEDISLSQFQGKKHVFIHFYHVDFGPL